MVIRGHFLITDRHQTRSPSYINLSVEQLLFVSKISWQPENWPRVGPRCFVSWIWTIQHIVSGTLNVPLV